MHSELCLPEPGCPGPLLGPRAAQSGWSALIYFCSMTALWACSVCVCVCSPKAGLFMLITRFHHLMHKHSSESFLPWFIPITEVFPSVSNTPPLSGLVTVTKTASSMTGQTLRSNGGDGTGPPDGLPDQGRPE